MADIIPKRVTAAIEGDFVVPAVSPYRAAGILPTLSRTPDNIMLPIRQHPYSGLRTARYAA
jgi:hypothetical protein